MTDNEIIKALECCRDNSRCYTCPRLGMNCCMNLLMRNALDLINSQKAENERLEKELMKCKLEKEMLYQNVEEIKSEAIKKFAEELKNYFSISECYLDIINIIDNFVKEMME